jgi:hypothetical protein
MQHDPFRNCARLTCILIAAVAFGAPASLAVTLPPWATTDPGISALEQVGQKPRPNPAPGSPLRCRQLGRFFFENCWWGEEECVKPNGNIVRRTYCQSCPDLPGRRCPR